MRNVMRKCNTSRACGVYVRMRLAARKPPRAARRRLGQPGEFAHANNAGPGRVALGPRLRPGPWQPDRRIRSARGLYPECTRPVAPNGNALMMRMRPFWVNGGPFPIKMLW